jgi:hypothetical protein
MGDRAALVRNLLIASIALVVIVVLARRARLGDGNDCPRELGQTRLAATLLWSQPGHAWPPPGSTASPENLALLEDPGDSETCARLSAAIPDTLAVGGVGAPFFTAFYRVADAYVVPVVPRVTRAEIESEERGETILWKEGVTLVFSRDYALLFTAPN